MNGLAKVCLALIYEGAIVNTKDQFGDTPLMWVARHGLANVCLALLDEYADVNARDQFGNIPLILAARIGNREVCMLLLRHMLLRKLVDADPTEGGNLSTRKMRMRCVIMVLKRTNINKHLITLILNKKPLLHDYTACRYDTYCCRFRLNEYYHSITRDQLYCLLGEGSDVLKATLQDAYDACNSDNPVLKNLLNPVNFDEHFDELFLKPLKPTIGE